MNTIIAAGDVSTGFFTSISDALKKVYSGISSIINICAVVAVAVCSIGMLASKNQKTVEEFKQWRNRVVITWLIFNMLGILISFGQEITAGMQYSE